MSAAEQVDVVVLGAGASGLFCAAQAGYRGRKVLVIEHTNRAGRKILMSGGGRCNFTHLDSTPANFLSANPHFCKSALSRYSPQDFVELVDRHGIEYHEKSPGQLFCNESSKLILAMLMTECDWAGVEVRLNCAVTTVTRTQSGFKLITADGELNCTSLVVATGGLSIPNGGATSFAYDLAEQFGLEVTERRAALVPFTLQPDLLTPLKELSGVSLLAKVSCNGQFFKENILFTHRGLSGPAVLQISSYWLPGDLVEVDLLPDIDLFKQMMATRDSAPRTHLPKLLTEYMSRRLAQTLCTLWQFDEELAQMSNERITQIAKQFHAWRLKPSGTEGYRKAEVTIGGIDTRCVSQRTFEAKNVAGLYFIGESLDVTGHLGGHNFQWAWASGYCCGQVC